MMRILSHSIAVSQGGGVSKKATLPAVCELDQQEIIIHVKNSKGGMITFVRGHFTLKLYN